MLGDAPTRRCRFCERTSRQVDFGDPRPIVPDRPSPLSAEVCQDCRLDWGDALDDEFRRFWDRLTRDAASGQHGFENRSRSPLTVAALKAMVAGALAIVPDADLPDFVDTIEWLSNPDHDLDDRLLVGAECRIYGAPFLHEDARASLSLARRIDDEAPVPYMLYFLAGDGIMVQVPLPLCLRDQDLDGREVEHPERALCGGIRPRVPLGPLRPPAAGRLEPTGEPGTAAPVDRLLRSDMSPTPAGETERGPAPGSGPRVEATASTRRVVLIGGTGLAALAGAAAWFLFAANDSPPKPAARGRTMSLLTVDRPFPDERTIRGRSLHRTQSLPGMPSGRMRALFPLGAREDPQFGGPAKAGERGGRHVRSRSRVSRHLLGLPIRRRPALRRAPVPRERRGDRGGVCVRIGAPCRHVRQHGRRDGPGDPRAPDDLFRPDAVLRPDARPRDGAQTTRAHAARRPTSSPRRSLLLRVPLDPGLDRRGPGDRRGPAHPQRLLRTLPRTGPGPCGGRASRRRRHPT